MSFIREGRNVGAITSYTTNFPATENPISQGGIWLNGQTDGVAWHDIQTTTNKEFAAVFDTFPGGTQDSIAQLKRSFLACTSDQYSQGTVFRVGGYTPASHECEVFCNMTIGANSATGYEAYFGIGNTHALVRWEGPFNTFTALASGNVNLPTEPADGDVIRIWRTGNTVFCSQNGITISSATDTTFTGGNPGLGNNPASAGGGVLASYGLKAWTCGNL